MLTERKISPGWHLMHLKSLRLKDREKKDITKGANFFFQVYPEDQGYTWFGKRPRPEVVEFSLQNPLFFLGSTYDIASKEPYSGTELIGRWCWARIEYKCNQNYGGERLTITQWGFCNQVPAIAEIEKLDPSGPPAGCDVAGSRRGRGKGRSGKKAA